jgi:transmembrane sensor
VRPTQSLSKEDRARLDVAADWMVRLQAEDIGEDQLAEWLAWYDEPANRQAFDEMEVVQEEVRAIDPESRTRFASRFINAEPESQRRWFDGFRLPTARWAAAAVAGIAAVTIVVIAFQGNWFATEGINTAYRTGRADHREVRLPDRSVVKLGAQSSLSINFTKQARYLVLEGGEALFSVEHDPARPFVVQAGSVRIRAIGTQFNVRRAEDSTFVAVKEGVVEVTQERMPPKTISANHDPAPTPVPEVLRVSAGEQALAARAEAPLRLTAIAPQAVATWQEGRLEFVDESLRTVIATVNRYSAREIVLTDPIALGKLRFTGIVMEGRVEEWISAIQEVFPIKAAVVGRGTILVSPIHE